MKDNQPMSPLLTFNKIKKNNIEMLAQQDQNRPQYFQSTGLPSQTSRNNLLRHDNPHCDSSRNVSLNPLGKTTVRMGSMVFGSLKREESKAIRESRSIDRMASFRTERDEPIGI
jgi:hypothetical protein